LRGFGSKGLGFSQRRQWTRQDIVTGHNAFSNDGQVKWRELASSADTLVILMGLHSLREIMNRLLEAGCEPVALIQSGTRPSQKSVVGTVATIADRAARANFSRQRWLLLVKW
jgi:siroheme synthase